MVFSGFKYVCISVCKMMVYISETADSIRQLCSATRISAFYFIAIFGLVTRNLDGSEKNFCFFPTLPIDIVGIMVYS